MTSELSAEGATTETDSTTADAIVWFRRPVVRLGLVGLVIIGLWTVGTTTGLVDSLTQDRVRELVEQAGIFGAVVYVAAFCLGQMMHLPGLLFVAAGAFAWGGVAGGMLASTAATLAVIVNFAMVRTIGGGALVDMRRPLLDKLLVNLHRRPVLTMIATRFFFVTSPILTTLLALSGVRHRDHAFSSLIGMAGPILVWALIFGAALR